MHMNVRAAVIAAAALALGTGLAGANMTVAHAAAAGVNPYTVTAKTAITNRPDSGDAGNDWANDGTTASPLERTVSDSLVKEVPLSNCGGSTGTGHCYQWSAKVSDSGVFVTIVGQIVPGHGDLNGGTAPTIGTAITGPMSGSGDYTFFSSWKTAEASQVPKTENDHGIPPTGRKTTGAWPEQAFGAGAQFFTVTFNPWSWSYTEALGSDSACPNQSGRWVDTSAGSGAVYGNIMASAAAGC